VRRVDDVQRRAGLERLERAAGVRAAGRTPHSTSRALIAMPRSSSGSTTASIRPCSKRFSAVWTPAGNGTSYSASYTRGPRKPMSAPGSAALTWPSEPKLAKTPPVVGCRR
jgi:hypothetical protein